MSKVSVILTSYNHAKFIKYAIESVLNQTYTNYELIIWDDCSEDNSWEIINGYKDKRIKAYRNKRNMCGKYINRALKVASGKYIAINHSDDIWEPEKLKKQVEYLDSNPKIGAVFSLVDIIDDDGTIFADENNFYCKIFQQENRTRHQWLNRFFYKGNCLCHPSILIRKKCYETIGYYDIRFAQLPDFDMWIRLCIQYDIHIIQEHLTRFRFHGDRSNASNSSESRNRDSFEYTKILNNFLNLSGKDEIMKIFPGVTDIINERSLIDADIRKYAVTQLALKADQNIHRVFAIDTLYDLLGQHKIAEKLEKLAGFTYKDFINLTGGSEIGALEMPIEQLPFTGERFTPEVHGSIELEHLHRYALACELAADKTVLDIACGEGYGSAMLAEKAQMVFGVDISENTIRHAQKRYQERNLKFLLGSCSDIPLPDDSVDLVVSFETIEHHDQHEKMLEEIKRVLRPDGILLISSPDKANYSDKSGFKNEYHVKELYENEFKRLINAHFKKSAYFGQRVLYGSGIFADSVSTKFIASNKNKESSIENNMGMLDPIYWIAIASDAEIPVLPSGVFEQPIDQSDFARTLTNQLRDKDTHIATLGGDIKDKDAHILNLDGSLRRIESSLSYKMGNIIVHPLAIIRNYSELILFLIKDSPVFNKNRLTELPAEFDFRGNLDNPNDGEAKHSTKCSGWFVSKRPVNKVVLFIGGKKITELERNTVRKDVDGAIRGYAHVARKGFEYIIPSQTLLDLKNKNRTLFIRFYIDDKHYVDKFHTIIRP